jgi:hypothetical protein
MQKTLDLGSCLEVLGSGSAWRQARIADVDEADGRCRVRYVDGDTEWLLLASHPTKRRKLMTSCAGRGSAPWRWTAATTAPRRRESAESSSAPPPYSAPPSITPPTQPQRTRSDDRDHSESESRALRPGEVRSVHDLGSNSSVALGFSVQPAFTRIDSSSSSSSSSARIGIGARIVIRAQALTLSELPLNQALRSLNNKIIVDINGADVTGWTFFATARRLHAVKAEGTSSSSSRSLVLISAPDALALAPNAEHDQDQEDETQLNKLAQKSSLSPKSPLAWKADAMPRRAMRSQCTIGEWSTKMGMVELDDAKPRPLPPPTHPSASSASAPPPSALKPASPMRAAISSVRKVSASWPTKGLAVRIWWTEEEKWFLGRVAKWNAAESAHKIVYEDGDVKWHVLTPGNVVWKPATCGTKRKR